MGPHASPTSATTGGLDQDGKRDVERPLGSRFRSLPDARTRKRRGTRVPINSGVGLVTLVRFLRELLYREDVLEHRNKAHEAWLAPRRAAAGRGGAGRGISSSE